MYAKLRDRITPSGYTIDDAIQVGVDNPGVPSRQYFGVSAGDEESYKVKFYFNLKYIYINFFFLNRCLVIYLIH
jgi:hypothetical protein